MSLIMYQSGIKQEKAYSKFYRIRPWTVLELIKCLWKAGAFVSGPGQTVGKGRLSVMAETKGKMKPARMSWYPCLSLTSYNSSEEGGLQKMLVPSPWSENAPGPGLERSWRRRSGRTWMSCQPSCCPLPPMSARRPLAMCASCISTHLQSSTKLLWIHFHFPNLNEISLWPILT